MSVTGINGFVAFAAQASKGVSATTLSKHRATGISMGTIQDQRPLPQEVGGTHFLTGTFKAGTQFGGGASFIPRLQDNFGLLLKGLLGAVEAPVQDGTYDGVYDHVFHPDMANTAALPWMTWMKYIPADDAGNNDLVEVGEDCKIASMQLAIPAAGLMTAQVGVVGRIPGHGFEPDFLTLEGGYTFNDFEDADSIALSCTGSLTVNAVPVKSTGVMIEFGNNLTNQEERIVGSYFLDDITTLSRVMTIRLIQKWNDPTLYAQAMYEALGASGAAALSPWSPVPFTAPISLVVQSPGNIGSTAIAPGKNDTPYFIQIDAPEVDWTVQTSPALGPGNLVMQEFIGVVKVPSAGNFVDVTLRNERSTTY